MILRGPFLSFVFSLILFSMKNQGDWNAVGAYTNICFYFFCHITFNIIIVQIVNYLIFFVVFFSTKSMRNTTGYDVILKAIENLVLPHKDHIAAYGEGNERRLTGHHEMKRLTSTLSVG